MAALPAIARAATPIPTDLTQPQLFLDDSWIEETSRLQRVWEQAEIFPEPVLRPETPWEGRQVVMYGSVFRIGGEWRMYYLTFNAPKPTLLCMATSSDGLRWQRPNLGLYEFNGSKANNIVWFPEPGFHTDGPTICHDPADPRAPFKMLYFAYGKGPAGQYAAFSKDGIAWDHRPTPVMTNTGDRSNVLGQRGHHGRFVAYLRHADMMKRHGARSVWVSESEDFLRWNEPTPILRPDLDDPPNSELYGMAAFRYSDRYIGLLEHWHGAPDRIEIQLAWSRGGDVWQRPAVRRPFLSGRDYPWAKAWVTCANTAPIQEGNQLWFYFGGRSQAHGREHPQSYGAIGLASLTMDRFAAIQADYRPGRLVTRPFTWPGGELALNCTNTRYAQGHPLHGGGEITVEILDSEGGAVDGYSAPHNVVSPRSRSTDFPPVQWPRGRSMRQLAGRRIRLAFTLRDARLYAFRSIGY
jgi:predicted GH43/DUF377 family glycosyl hydrolase